MNTTFKLNQLETLYKIASDIKVLSDATNDAGLLQIYKAISRVLDIAEEQNWITVDSDEVQQ